MSPAYYIVQQTGREANIYIFGDIVSEQWYQEETSAFSLKEEIKGLDVDVINVYIDSYGGLVSEGWAIYNELRRHPAKIRTYGTGFVASAALYPFMAGDERYAMVPSAYFFHLMISGGFGNAEELRKAAEELEKLGEIGRAAFTENTSLTAEEVLELEQNETWLSPQEALEKGIATAMITNRPAAVPAQSIRGAVFQKVLAAGNKSAQEIPAPKMESKPASVMEALHGMFEKRKEGNK